MTVPASSATVPSPGRPANRLTRWPEVTWPDLLAMVLQDLERNPWRTLLTMLGLVIGAAAVVAVASVGLAGRDYAIRQLETLGTNFMWVSYHGPSDESAASTLGTGRRELSERDFEEIRENATALAAVTRIVVAYTALTQGGRTYPITLVGTDGDYARVRNLSLTEGRVLTEPDVNDRRKICVLSHSLAGKLYGRRSALGRSLRIEDFDFTVIGVFRDVHTPGVETEISREAVLIPISVARFFSRDTSIDTVYAQARSRELVGTAAAQVRQVLARLHGRSDLYTVGTLTYFVRVVQRISATLMGVVVILALLALLVGGVGILNIMLISVSERTREIGLRMAIGARRLEILRLFFLEALVISLTGGAVGILLGSLGPTLVGVAFDFPMPVSLLSIIVALAVSVLVGVAFGILPAIRAARLDPVVALRYE
jgi:putative ABC transport system permease protein